MTSGDEPSEEGPLTAERWQDLLTLELSCPVRVVYTRARRTPIQVKRVSAPRRGVQSALEVRLHSMFSGAPPDVHRAVASWIRSGTRAPRACAALDDWIASTLETIPAAVRIAEDAGRGRTHDLDSLAAGLVAREFAGVFTETAPLPAITWGRRGASRTRSSLRLGSFDPDPRVVRIHAVLDQEGVPTWFVRFVLFHELLHAVHPPTRGSDNRWIHHGREFRRLERGYVDFERAIAWEKRHLRTLIRAARRDVPFVPAAEASCPPIATPTRPTGVRGFLQRLMFPS